MIGPLNNIVGTEANLPRHDRNHRPCQDSPWAHFDTPRSALLTPPRALLTPLHHQKAHFCPLPAHFAPPIIKEHITNLETTTKDLLLASLLLSWRNLPHGRVLLPEAATVNPHQSPTKSPGADPARTLFSEDLRSHAAHLGSVALHHRCELGNNGAVAISLSCDCDPRLRHGGSRSRPRDPRPRPKPSRGLCPARAIFHQGGP
jgi:hypothetical protein